LLSGLLSDEFPDWPSPLPLGGLLRHGGKTKKGCRLRYFLEDTL
jgi:hypothetical protein